MTNFTTSCIVGRLTAEDLLFLGQEGWSIDECWQLRPPSQDAGKQYVLLARTVRPAPERLAALHNRFRAEAA